MEEALRHQAQSRPPRKTHHMADDAVSEAGSADQSSNDGRATAHTSSIPLAPEMELIFKPYPRKENAPPIDPLNLETRFLKTTSNASGTIVNSVGETTIVCQF